MDGWMEGEGAGGEREKGRGGEDGREDGEVERNGQTERRKRRKGGRQTKVGIRRGPRHRGSQWGIE